MTMPLLSKIGRYSNIAILVAIFSVFAQSAWAARDVGSQRECATCHVSWIKTFKIKGVKTLIPKEKKQITKTGKQDSSSTNKMCFSCHDGFVLDSRKVWQGKGHTHPVGVKPSKNMKIPTSKGKKIFPLNDDGKMYCGTCHTAHGVDWKQSESPLFLRVKNVESSLCLACHLDKSTGPAEGNHPVFKSLEKRPGKLIAAGAKLGADNGVTCETCHIAHTAPTRMMLVATTKNAELCGHCHSDKKSVVGTKHDMAIMAPDIINIKGDTVEKSGTCVACHLPHKAQGPALWARERYEGVDPSAASCLGCHNNDTMAHEKTLTDFNHPVGVPVKNLDISVKGKQWYGHDVVKGKDEKLQALPLYNKQGLRKKNARNVGCGSCHDPHQWSADKKQQGKNKPNPKKVEGDTTNSFLRIADTGNSDLCINCHLKKRSVLLTKHNQKIYAPDKGNEGLCTSCHQPHNAKQRPLWARDLGPGKSDVGRLCTDCHKKEGLAKDTLPGKHSHPVSIALKSGMKTSLPLHHKLQDKNKLKKDKKLDCSTCHNTHQWDPNNVASKSGASMKAEGDGKTSFLRITSHDSKLCLDCHKQKGSVRKSEHDLNVTAAKAVNNKNETVEKSGVCGQCHAVHQAESAMALWGRKLDKDGADVNNLCLSCHSDGKIAENKQPISYKHPKETLLWSQAIRNDYGRKKDTALPVFDKQGKRADVGRIACATCHNAHQWQSGNNKPGSGKNTEGDVTNSFLRTKHTKGIVCADCHGEEAIFRYKYFHGESAHKKYPMFR
ncbi:MAG: hypothetical protein IME93_05910 [Proteobacteria bacterium]|nr:hypothetical protein [Pseudomonadota bacterium]